MSILPKTEYRDLFYTRNFGPFQADDFGEVAGLSSASLSTSISSSDTLDTHSAFTSASLTSAQGLLAAGENGLHSFCPDKDTWIDYVWCRADVVSSVASARIRLLIVNDGQQIATAYQGGQWLTQSQNIGSSSSISTDAWDAATLLDPLLPHTLNELAIVHRAGQPYNKVPAGGLLVLAASVNPTALVNLVVGIRCRERAM